VKKKEKSGRLI
jgi:hypothetical protein